MSLSSLFSAIFPTVHADAPEEKAEKPPQEESQEEPAKEPQEEEEEEPEDILPALQEECTESAKCAPLAQHFAHCEEKVHAGEGYKGEDCVEELYVLLHLMHCVNGCVAPKLFSKLK
ncbi:ubiquinol-cytochrome C reductase hinge domain-containing protein [Dichomitus squalens]|uniref:Ubiquinol-cytochrome C reductase hinge domain-containing protein n=1 Tax=Dichomitus squalens TaxID=114155 RepID=A0A4Q9MCN2_9APHY|nr:ubiquinol-cytochrome C reductase hinge domain-containing protein [Dichomitus squalens]